MIDWGAASRRDASSIDKLRAFLRLRFPGASRGVRSRGQRSSLLAGEEGATLVEMAVSTAVLFLLVIGMMEMCLALYAYNFISNAARDATRYAAVRGANSCQNDSTPDPNCNLLPTSVTSSTNNPLYTYINNLGAPALGSGTLTVSPTWWTATVTDVSGAPATTVWNTQCTGQFEANESTPCNNPGNAVRVIVTYTFPLNIPFWKSASLTMESTSQMAICN